jgi:hypothetical protein
VRPSILLLTVPLTFVGAAACQRPQKPERVAEGYLFEKGPYQGFYDGAGKLTRLLYDQNGDKKADVVMLFYPNGRLRQVEADTDFDGKIDRWQYYSERGVAEKEGYSRAGNGKPDTWQYFDVKGNLTRREIDENGDGKVDRIENFQNGRVASIGVDSDGDAEIKRAGRSGWTGACQRGATSTATASASPLRYGAKATSWNGQPSARSTATAIVPAIAR